MKKSIVISIIFVVICSLTIPAIAYAQSAELPARRLVMPRVLGQVLSIGENQFTIKKPTGEQVTINVDENTRYWFLGEGKGSFEELTTGRWVIGFGRVNENSEAIARLVIILPKGFDPKNLPTQRIFGQVNKVDTEKSTITVELKNGDDNLIKIDENTRFVGKIKSLPDITSGMVILSGVKEVNGSLVSVILFATTKDHLPTIDQRIAGRITSVSEENITIDGQDGKSYSFQLSKETQFRGLRGGLIDLKNLKEGMRVFVAAQELADGKYEAKLITIRWLILPLRINLLLRP